MVRNTVKKMDNLNVQLFSVENEALLTCNFTSYFHAQQWLAFLIFEIYCLLLLFTRLFTVPYFSVGSLRSSVLPLIAAILIFRCTESNLGKSIKST